MSKDFLYATQDADSPYELIERDIDVHGESFIKELDNSEFQLYYGIDKDEFLYNSSVEFALFTRERLEPYHRHVAFTQQSFENFMKGFREEGLLNISSQRITASDSTAKKLQNPANQPKPTSVRPSQVKKKSKKTANSTPPQAAEGAKSKPKPAPKKRPLPYPAQNAKKAGDLGQEQIKKEFAIFKRDLLKKNRGPLMRKTINLKEKALRSILIEQGIKWGSPEWAALVKKFFPMANFPALNNAGEAQEDTAQTPDGAPKNYTAPSNAPAAQNKGNSLTEAAEPADKQSAEISAASRQQAAAEKEKGKGGDKEKKQEKSAEETHDKEAKAPPAQAVNKAPQKAAAPPKAKQRQKATAVPKVPKASPSDGSPLTISKPADTLAKVNDTVSKTDSKPDSGELLEKKSEAAFQLGVNKIGQASAKQQETKSADKKTAEAQRAVEPPASEAVSQSNSATVNVVDKTPDPKVDPKAPKDSIASKMKDELPTTEDDVKRLKDRNPAQAASKEMNKLIGEQTAGVKQTYQQIENTPKPVPQKAEAPLPALEPKPKLEQMALGEELLPPVPGEQTDFQEYTKAGDDMVQNELQDPDMMKEFETSDAQPMVEAREARDGIREDADAAPQEIAELEKQEHANINHGLAAEEQSVIAEMEAERQTGLSEAQSTQQDTKTAFEKEKERVSEHINKIYERTNDHIQTKLELLETQSMQAFEAGQQAAFDTFETTVTEELDAFFEERHSGIGGFFTAIGDFFSGTEDLPEVQEIFERNRVIFIDTIDALIEEISNKSATVITECKQLLADAKAEIAEYVAGLDESLKSFGAQCQSDVDDKLKILANGIAQKEAQMAEKLAEMRKSAVEALDKRIEERKEAMKGALNKLGSFLLDLALKFFNFTLTALGMDPEQIMNMINKGIDTLTLVVTNPKGFFSNLGSAVKKGLGQFQANFMQHMIGGMLEWLTGAMGGSIFIPTSFSLGGIFKMGLSVLGLTWENIRLKLVKHLGENIVAAAEKGFEVVTVLVKEGPMGLWEWIKAEAENIKNQVIDGIIQWALTAIVKSAVTQLALMCNPVGAIVRAIIAIYDLVMWLIDNIQRILSFVNSVVDSVSAIATGQIGGAANYIESSIAKTIPMILSGLAQFLKLGGIAKKIQDTIEKVRKPIDKAINKGIGFIVKKVKKWFGKKKPKKGDAKKQKEENKKGKAEELDPKDKKKHKEIAGEIEKDLKKPKKKDKEDFKAFHKRMQQKGESLEDKYQSKLKKGINLDVKFKSAKEDEKDGDMDIKISIKPNTTEKKVTKKVYALGKEIKELIKKLKPLPGSKGLIGYLESEKIFPWFKHGFKTQAERAIHYNSNGRLIDIEHAFSDSKTGKMSRFDLVIKDIDSKGKDTGEKIVVEVKNWTGFAKLDEKTKDIRINSLENQLKKYKASKNKVLLEWKGTIPDEVQELCEDMNIDVQSI